MSLPLMANVTTDFASQRQVLHLFYHKSRFKRNCTVTPKQTPPALVNQGRVAQLRDSHSGELACYSVCPGLYNWSKPQVNVQIMETFQRILVELRKEAEECA